MGQNLPYTYIMMLMRCFGFGRFGFGVVPLALGVALLGLVVTGYADSTNPTGTSDGATANALSCNLYQQTKSLMEGQIGVLVGLILVFIGLWNLISGKGWFSAILAIVVGAAIPSVPGLVESFVEGYRTLMIESQMTPESISTGTNNAGQGEARPVFSMTTMTNCMEGVQTRASEEAMEQNLSDTLRGLRGL